MSGKIQEYPGQALVVRYDVGRCIHARECLRGLPAVFNAGNRPWVAPDAAPADEVLRVVMRCPTGALHAERRDGGPGEPPPEENTVTLRPAGPLYLRGDLAVVSPEGEVLLRDTRMALCRCGASKNKPFCDGSHSAAVFSDPGRVTEVKLKDLPVEGRTLRLTPKPNGPVLVEGPVKVVDAGGAVAAQGTRGAFCRCGASSSKPFCDGTHNKIGFST
jgi:CDGSH-type Zn-finger protein/uncharacterized Fe-S cluster protein YjdI